ncbi:MAG: M14 family metallopeptidase [Candidatus Xenobia bacterium]
MLNYDPSRIYRYDDLAAIMRQVASRHPHLVTVSSIGQSPQGRDLLLAEVTNRSTGAAADKPACWVDGNTHATELAGSAAALHTLVTLAEQYNQDADVTRLLDHAAVYILPRLSPDGAEHCLTTGDWIRSTPKPYPFEARWEGLRPQDINGDGLIVQMRVEDSLGEWKVSREDARVLVRRAPDDREGPFYHVYREGVMENWEGHRIEVSPTPYAMDFNRNYPYMWAPEHVQRGAGAFPLSAPETRAVVAFMAEHRNIGVVQTFHTYSGCILRPLSTHPDEEIDRQDLGVFKTLGQRGTQITGYPCLSTYHDFRYGPKELIRGGFDDWCYDHYGAFSFTTEIWSIGKAAGLEVKDHIKFLQERTEAETVQILRWADEQGIDAFVPWTAFEHPQLGRVEIGGFKLLAVWSNPPAKLLPEISEKMARWVISSALALPRLRIGQFQAEAMGAGLRRLRLKLENQGWLPTHVSERALAAKMVRPIEVTLELPPGVDLLMGRPRTEIPHLAGTASVVADTAETPVYFRGVTQEHRTHLEWLIRGEGEVAVTVRSERAGVCRAALS